MGVTEATGNSTPAPSPRTALEEEEKGWDDGTAAAEGLFLILHSSAIWGIHRGMFQILKFSPLSSKLLKC